MKFFPEAKMLQRASVNTRRRRAIAREQRNCATGSARMGEENAKTIKMTGSGAQVSKTTAACASHTGRLVK